MLEKNSIDNNNKNDETNIFEENEKLKFVDIDEFKKDIIDLKSNPSNVNSLDKEKTYSNILKEKSSNLKCLMDSLSKSTKIFEDEIKVISENIAPIGKNIISFSQTNIENNLTNKKKELKRSKSQKLVIRDDIISIEDYSSKYENKSNINIINFENGSIVSEEKNYKKNQIAEIQIFDEKNNIQSNNFQLTGDSEDNGIVLKQKNGINQRETKKNEDLLKENNFESIDELLIKIRTDSNKMIDDLFRKSNNIFKDNLSLDIENTEKSAKKNNNECNENINEKYKSAPNMKKSLHFSIDFNSGKI